jgi:hypothetical protein
MPIIQDFHRPCNHPPPANAWGDFAHVVLTRMVRYSPMPGQVPTLK